MPYRSWLIPAEIINAKMTVRRTDGKSGVKWARYAQSEWGQ
jgi:hypothetical protein